MPWKFDPQSIDLVFINITTQMVESGSLDFGDNFQSDLTIDTGDRTNEVSTIDGGLRVVDGSI
jgi:hypothetical protein